MPIFRLTPSYHETPWGGERLAAYGKPTDGGHLGESWELSFVPGGEACLADGRRVSEVFGREAYGKRAEGMPAFPTLTKFIDARENLSVQVHPSDAYALEKEGQYGKSELWYILEAEEGAGIYLGLREATDAETLRRAACEGRAEELLRFVPVRRGDRFPIPPGTIHAIGAGVLLFEIQQNSTLTYRLYDYGRRDAAGHTRELHLDKALDVADLAPYRASSCGEDDPSLLGRTPYFEARYYKLNFTKREFLVTEDTFLSITVVDGEGRIGPEPCKKGDTFFLPAVHDRVSAEGDLSLITVSLPEKEDENV